MEYLKIENNKGLFYREGEGMKEVSKMTKDDLYDLVHAAIHEEDFSMDAYDEELLKNPAHQTIYSHVYRQLGDIHIRREEYLEEVDSMYKEAFNKYCAE